MPIAETRSRSSISARIIANAPARFASPREQRDAGNFGAAIDALEQSLVILRGRAEPDDRFGDRQCADGARADAEDLRRSRACGRATKKRWPRTRTPDPAGRVRPVILHGLANLYRDRNEHQRAIALYAQALPLFVDLYGAQSTMLAQVLNNYGNALANAKQYAEGDALYRRALAIAEEGKSKDQAIICRWRTSQ